LKGLPAAFDGTTVAQISDLHHSSLVPAVYLEKCVEMVNRLSPDIILLTGDYVTSEGWAGRADVTRDYVQPLPELLSPLKARFGRFAVLGNHDTTVNPRAITKALQEAGIHVLRNERLALTRDGARLPIVGFADFGTEYADQRRALAGIRPEEPAVIMSHNPDLFGRGINHRNGIVFAGHTHGGQVRVPFMKPFYVPSVYDDRFLSGRFQEGDLTMLVNRGLGVIRYRIRFNCPPEITFVTLRAA
jgi:uncharacterized protein